MSDLIKTQMPLTNDEREILKIIVNAIIPASDDLSLPGAADTTVFAGILAGISQYEELFRQGLITINQQAEVRFQTSFVDASRVQQSELYDELKDSGSNFVRILQSTTLASYYQDPRVLEALNIEARPPFPRGHDVQQGDWSLLDPVRKREKFFREV